MSYSIFLLLLFAVLVSSARGSKNPKPDPKLIASNTLEAALNAARAEDFGRFKTLVAYYKGPGLSDYDMRMFANYYEYIVLKAEFNEDGHVETICTTSPTDRLYFFKFKPSSESPTGWTSYLAK
ncbi:hypothetical protein GCK72_022083 [Caenorhabditis remanei]|uniref:Uncharacterized protein n=3 Tax=Caenorhabditis remanei TaxID=31234 RepID=E3MAJ0_CAERE|nr:hypothetical protein GCK72_022082 [Caenorhabditis remanei]XP_003106876.1 hypothetical protein GCK72_022091 [Caenorhabditis remanei]XP_053578211.1 hypothetical protein GCK72_022083 [Caenorhabditis remanei]EFO96716.1 hypothetical protein CRE_17172 [Caenorhabditis remanei]EFP00889.1 hypothetical protein CRE_11514 [Caenorhabditis remanei]KAF1745635.1 hypothetical protein GCK72_022082 [Caenorhabditis remanei]KAF1745636.1 hypothetical protein GCK72_022083 [Caenorhabditis remanei]KAF1745644.1 hy